MCLGDTVVFICIANGTGSAVWRGDKGTTRVLDNVNIQSKVVDSFTISVIEIINSNTVVSTATAQSVNLTLNGSSVSCGNGKNEYLTEYVKIAGNIVE